MKRISYLAVVCLLCTASVLNGQDAAEERYKKLAGQVEDLLAGQMEQKKMLDKLSREIDVLREQAAKPNSSYASEEDVKRLAEAVREVDKKRLEDYEKIKSEIKNLGKTLTATPPPSRSKPPVDVPPSTGPEKGYDYIIKSGDNLSVIAQAYREQGVKVTVEQIEKANPGVDSSKLKVGQKIFIPAPK